VRSKRTLWVGTLAHSTVLLEWVRLIAPSLQAQWPQIPSRPNRQSQTMRKPCQHLSKSDWSTGQRKQRILHDSRLAHPLRLRLLQVPAVSREISRGGDAGIASIRPRRPPSPVRSPAGMTGRLRYPPPSSVSSESMTTRCSLVSTVEFGLAWLRLELRVRNLPFTSSLLYSSGRILEIFAPLVGYGFGIFW
jgi:hypothetical protein